MKIRFWLLFAALLLLNSTARSQSTDFPLTPADIFAADLEIREVTIEPSPGQNFGLWDDELRLLVVDGHVIPYAPEFNRIFALRDWNDPVVLLTVSPVATPSSSEVWAYHRHTGELAPFTDPCQVQLNPYVLVDSPWVIYEDPVTGDQQLCRPTTGERRGALPGGSNPLLQSPSVPSQRVTISPDQRWVVYFVERDRSAEFPALVVDVYSYDLTTDQVTLLGTDEIRDGSQSHRFERWIADAVFISSMNIASEMLHFSYILRATAGVENSLKTVISTSPGRGNIAYRDHPPRYLLGLGADSDDGLCGRTTYDITTDTLTNLKMDGLCRPEYGSVDGVGYYRDVPRGQSSECCDPVPVMVAEVPVVRYDTRTGEREELYRGEIEDIVWISPDEHYGIFISDNNGRIDRFPYLSSYAIAPFGDGQPDRPVTVLVDLTTGEDIEHNFLCEPHMSFDWTSDDWAINEGIEPLNDGSFLIASNDGGATCGGREAMFASRLTLADRRYQYLIDNVIKLTPDRDGLFFWDPAYNFDGTPPPQQGISIYDLTTGAIHPFINPLDTSKVAVESLWINQLEIDNQAANMSVTIRSLTSTHREQPETRTYWIRLADLTENYSVTFFDQQPAETPLQQHVCILTTTTGVNLRVGAGGNLDLFGTAEAGKRLVGVGQSVSQNDGLIWYQLNGGGWVRTDFVSGTSACATLPDPTQAAQPGANGGVATVPAVPAATVTCQLTTLLDANFRAEPSAEAEKIGSALADTVLETDGRLAGSDSFTWWRLVDGQGWLREDLVAEAEDCAALPVVSLEPIPTRDPGLITCQMTTLQGVNFRAQPSAEAEKIGSALADTVLEADGQFAGADGFVWWRLVAAQGWVRQDLVAETEGCSTLPVAAEPANR